MQDNLASEEMDPNPIQSEKLSIKNLLFTKAIPNYVLPIPLEGRPVYACKDCGDKFIIKSSYEDHIQRKSLKITYFCRHCNISRVFFNRCDLLSHIRSHVFKTATISINDLTIEPLPLLYFKHFSKEMYNGSDTTLVPLFTSVRDNETPILMCQDCNKNIFCSGIPNHDRALHYTFFSNMEYTCPVCQLILTTKCALEAHLRIHIQEPPYFCPDCGISLSDTAILYPYDHECESFKTMRNAAKAKCIAKRCNKIIKAVNSISHLKTVHIKYVYKCPTCKVACYKLGTMLHHLGTDHSNDKTIKHIEYIRCEMCPGRLIFATHLSKHLDRHEREYIIKIFDCWKCGKIFTSVKDLLGHQELFHSDTPIQKVVSKARREPITVNIPNPVVNVPQQKVMQCIHAPSTSKAPPQNIEYAPCKCQTDSTPKIVCNLCKSTVTQDWNIIKKHYAIHHKEHTCLDAKLVLKRVCTDKDNTPSESSKKPKTKPNNSVVNEVNNECIASGSGSNGHPSASINKKFVCGKCGVDHDTKENLEKHLVIHRDPFMAFQCLECGESFIAKPSFSTHLIMNHGIYDVDKYISEKKCYCEESLYLQQPSSYEPAGPVQENQCSICREYYPSSMALEKHFRVHGMAFLMRNTNKNQQAKKTFP